MINNFGKLFLGRVNIQPETFDHDDDYSGGGGTGGSTGGGEMGSYNYSGPYSLYVSNPTLYGYIYGTSSANWVVSSHSTLVTDPYIGKHFVTDTKKSYNLTTYHVFNASSRGSTSSDRYDYWTDNGDWGMLLAGGGNMANYMNNATAGGGNMKNYMGKGIQFGLHMANSFAAPFVNTFTSATFPLINEFNIIYKEGLHEGPAYSKATNINWLKPYRLTEDWKLVGIDGAITDQYINGQTENEELMYLANSTIKTNLNILSLRVHLSANIFKDYALKFGFKIPFYNFIDNMFIKPKPKKKK